MTALTSRLQALNNAFTLATTFVSLAVRIGCKGTRNVLDKHKDQRTDMTVGCLIGCVKKSCQRWFKI